MDIEKTLSLAQTCLEEELYWGALLLCDILYRTNKTSQLYYIVLRSLYHLKFYERCIQIIEENKSLLKLYQIRKIYYISFTKTKIDNKKVQKFEDECIKTDFLEMRKGASQLNRSSVLLMLEALTKTDSVRKRILLEAYKTDTGNLEALYVLKRDGLVSRAELDDLINISTNAQLYSQIFTPVFSFGLQSLSFFSPYYCLKLAKVYYKAKKSQLLFNLGVHAVKAYPTSEFAYSALGLYFLVKANFTEAKKCFYKAVELDKTFGKGYLYLGMAYSGLKESDNALSALNLAQRYMVGSYKPSFYLGFENHKMNSFERASFFYKQALKIKQSVKIKQKYISLLIYYEYYNEALSYLACHKDESLDLLRVYCNLFLAKIKDAQRHLGKCAQDWRYFATAGFIEHVLNKFDEAAENYCRAQIMNRNTLVDDLLGLSIENAACKQENNVYDYATDLFESMGCKNNSFDII